MSRANETRIDRTVLVTETRESELFSALAVGIILLTIFDEA
jgi:hypothetical protein